MEIFTLLIAGLGWLMVLLILYVILFKIYYAGHRYWWLYPAAAIFVVLDFLVNAIVITPLMLELPREWLVTDRMKRYKKIEPSQSRLKWLRYHFADNMCLILNVFDKSKGGHC